MVMRWSVGTGRLLTVVVLGLAVISAAGCTDSTTPGKVTATSTANDAALWDPCTQLPAYALSAAGLDPASRDSTIRFHGWKMCSWEGSWYYLNVYSTGKPLDEVARTAGLKDPRRVTIGPRSVTQLSEDDSVSAGCDIGFTVPQGTISFQVKAQLGTRNPGDPCVEVIRLANDLQGRLPSGK